MRPAARAATASAATESTSLISEHDLPEWIRQIAADDAKKLIEAQAHEEAAAVESGSSMPSHFGRRALPGETLTSGPASSSWLSRRDAVAGAAESAWDLTGAPPARPIAASADLAPPVATAAPVGTSRDAVDVVVTDAVVAPSKRRRLRAASVEKPVSLSTEPRGNPLQGLTRGDPKRLYLILAIAVLLLAVVAMSLL